MAPNSKIQGLTLRDFLYLDISLTQEAFVRALIDSGVYEPTEEQMRDYQNSADWNERFNLSSCTISHPPKELPSTSKL